MNKPLDFEQELERRKKNQRLANAIFAVDGLKTNPNTQHIFNDYANGDLATIAEAIKELDKHYNVKRLLI